MNAYDLYRYSSGLERDGYDSRPYWVELQSRIAMSLTPLIVTLIGGSLIPLAGEKQHSFRNCQSHCPDIYLLALI